MERKKLGEVTEEEKKEIKSLFERKLALQDLLCVLPEKELKEETKDVLYQKTMIDLGTTKLKFDSWWDDILKKYNWVIEESGSLNIDFITNEIYFITNQ